MEWPVSQHIHETGKGRPAGRSTYEKNDELAGSELLEKSGCIHRLSVPFFQSGFCRISSALYRIAFLPGNGMGRGDPVFRHTGRWRVRILLAPESEDLRVPARADERAAGCAETECPGADHGLFPGVRVCAGADARRQSGAAGQMVCGNRAER